MKQDEAIDGRVPMADLVAYQDGSVVSRTVLKKETGTVTVFAFDAGQSLSEHTVPHDALVVVGAYGHGVARELFFGSKMELIQTVLPNPMLIVGPGCGV